MELATGWKRWASLIERRQSNEKAHSAISYGLARGPFPEQDQYIFNIGHYCLLGLNAEAKLLQLSSIFSIGRVLSLKMETWFLKSANFSGSSLISDTRESWRNARYGRYQEMHHHHNLPGVALQTKLCPSHSINQIFWQIILLTNIHQEGKSLKLQNIQNKSGVEKKK